MTDYNNTSSSLKDGRRRKYDNIQRDSPPRDNYNKVTPSFLTDNNNEELTYKKTENPDWMTSNNNFSNTGTDFSDFGSRRRNQDHQRERINEGVDSGGRYNFSKTANNFNRDRPNTATLRNINEEDEFGSQEMIGGFSRVLKYT